MAQGNLSLDLSLDNFRQEKKLRQGVGKLPDLESIVAKLAALFYGCLRFNGLPGLPYSMSVTLKVCLTAGFAIQMIELLFKR